jgi:hypothetical protein
MKITGAKRRPLTILACMLAVGIVAPAAAAGTGTWAEGTNGTGDAGDLPSTAQRPVLLSSPSPVNTLTSISGTISTSLDRDMYRVCRLVTGAASATTVGTPGTLSDTQLFLFLSLVSGAFGLEANDDSAASLRSTLPPEVLSSGVYYLAISGFDADPVSVGGEIFPDFPFDGVYGPTGPGGASPIIGWSGSGGTGTYTINLTGWYFCGGL